MLFKTRGDIALIKNTHTENSKQAVPCMRFLYQRDIFNMKHHLALALACLELTTALDLISVHYFRPLDTSSSTEEGGPA